MKFTLPSIALLFALLGLYFIACPKSQFDKEKLVASNFLSSKIPAKFDNVFSTEKPLGDTEEVTKATEKQLVVSDYLNREYTLSDGRKFTLYISYWMPSREVIERASAHTPDRCWIENGWRCNEKTRRFSDVIEVAGKKIMPARYGEYAIQKGGVDKPYVRYVWYWFVADGKIYEYTKSNYFPGPIQWLKNSFVSATEGAPEMFFVRIDADYPLDDIRNNKEFLSLLEKLGEMVLFEKQKTDEENAK